MSHRKKDRNKPTTHRRSRRRDGRDQATDIAIGQQLQGLIQEQRDLEANLEHQLSSLAQELVNTRLSICTVAELYEILSRVDFSALRHLSSSAYAARERRGVPHASSSEGQTQEVDEVNRFYRQLQQASHLGRHIETLPLSLSHFEAEEQQIIGRIKRVRGELALKDRDMQALRQQLSGSPYVDWQTGKPYEYPVEWVQDPEEGFSREEDYYWDGSGGAAGSSSQAYS